MNSASKNLIEYFLPVGLLALGFVSGVALVFVRGLVLGLVRRVTLLNKFELNAVRMNVQLGGCLYEQ